MANSGVLIVRNLSVLRRVVVRLLFALLLLTGLTVPIAAAQVNLFGTEQQAQQHCPSDIVVWLNVPSGIYHFKGQRWYGRTKHGAFVCKKEADQAGDRGTRNGQ